jgi:hypothetical protein
LLQKEKKGAHQKFRNATGLFYVGFDPAYLGIVVVVVVERCDLYSFCASRNL